MNLEQFLHTAIQVAASLKFENARSAIETQGSGYVPSDEGSFDATDLLEFMCGLEEAVGGYGTFVGPINPQECTLGRLFADI